MVKAKDPEHAKLPVKQLLQKVVEPEVERASRVFEKVTKSKMTGMEKEILKFYLFHCIKGTTDE